MKKRWRKKVMDFIVVNAKELVSIVTLFILIVSVAINIVCISKLKSLCCKQRIYLKESKDLVNASKRIESMFDSINQRVKFMSSILKAKRKSSKENDKKRPQNKKPYNKVTSGNCCSSYGSYGNRKSNGYSNTKKPKNDYHRSYDRHERENSTQVTV